MIYTVIKINDDSKNQEVNALVRLEKEITPADHLRGTGLRSFKIDEPLTGREFFNIHNEEYVYYINYYGRSMTISFVNCMLKDVHEFNDDEDALLWFKLNY
jgi:hypothetical protein